MGFYTAEWVRRLLKEDHKRVQEVISKKGNDFRSYIDSTLPFSLYMDIDETIRPHVLSPNTKAIKDLSELLKVPDPNTIIDILDKTYQKLITSYINNPRFTKITASELQENMARFNAAVMSQEVLPQLKAFFSKTMVVTNVSKENKRVLIIFPSFRTISDRFGRDFKEILSSSGDLEVLSDFIDDELGDSPRNIFKKYIDGNFGVLQNLGHVEVDVISSESSEIKRGLVSPRLLQALVALPKEAKVETLVRKFSKETGQAETRIKVRKMFKSNALALEVLVESGIMIGSLESREANLAKAPLEKKFEIGAGLTEQLRKNPNILLDLETSKSFKAYLADSFLSAITTGKSYKSYDSLADIKVSTKVTKTKVELVLPKPSTRTGTKPKVSVPASAVAPLSSLLLLLQQNIKAQVELNMGQGSRRDVLNYRSGRFANSVEVQRVTQSREGMVSVFYDYMKYPYATFSTGGKQEFPRSRDPKLLISKSIREIGAEAAYTRMRAVLV